MARQSREDLLTLRQMIEEGKVKPVVERTYSLAEAAEAVCPWPRQTPHPWPRNSPLTATT
jgi:hypothetical protein